MDVSTTLVGFEERHDTQQSYLIAVPTVDISGSVKLAAVSGFAVPAYQHEVQISEHCQAVFDIMPGPSRRESWWSRDRDLYTLLKTFSGTEATRQHDRIYALLGLCPEADSKITTDYNKTIPQLIQEIVAFICECNIDDVQSINLDTVPKFLDNLKTIHNRVLECMFKYSYADVAEAYLLKNKAKLYVGPKLCEIAADYGNRSDQVRKIIFGLDRRVLKSKYAGGEKLLGIIRHGNNGIATAKVLLERHPGDIINHYNAKGITPLIAAAKLGNWSLVKLLLAHGADYDFEDYLRRTPLSYASDAGHTSIVELLLIEDAGCQYGTTLTGGDTPLMLASRNGHITIVQLLLDGGADHSQRNMNGDTALMVASARGYEPIVRRLLDCGADINVQNKAGKSSLSLAALGGHKATVRLLYGWNKSLTQDEVLLIVPILVG